jgi:hypothetical protein
MNFIIGETEHLRQTLCGGCNKCGTKFFFGDNIIEIVEYKNTMFKLQYCDDICKKERTKMFPILDDLTFINKTLVKPIKFDNLYNMFAFIINHPWSFNYKAEEMVSYVEELKGKETLSWRERGFMNNFNKYIKEE